ncbi:hypothetical protein IFR04_010806 [Cadophora malorum]|uniref:F-box domain-containing protein n=1 Tax=Cadophora malorum TaxID=108018 RepID=A0A8H7TC10_9HELO|nr:hypothetical protein IFR04_010806 [Cadophora malorum]
MMHLLDLPVELLALIPLHLRNIEDFTNASSSCRTLRNAFSKTRPNQILRLAAASSRVFFRPDPHFLIAATVRQVSDWALQSPENAEVLRAAFMGGVDSLLALCVEKAGITVEDIRRLYLMRFSTLNPVADLIDRSAGAQWYSAPNFWNGGVSDAATIHCDPTRTMYQIIIYGELFSSSFQALLQSEKQLSRFDINMRLDYIRYCIPDDICFLGAPGMERPKEVGPYDPVRFKEDRPEPDQVAMRHVLLCRRWREAWEEVRRQVGGDFEDGWRQDMWKSLVECQGLFGLAMIRPGNVEPMRERLLSARRSIEALSVQPRRYRFGKYENQGTEYPDLVKEVFILMAGYWQT